MISMASHLLKEGIRDEAIQNTDWTEQKQDQETTPSALLCTKTNVTAGPRQLFTMMTTMDPPFHTIAFRLVPLS